MKSKKNPGSMTPEEAKAALEKDFGEEGLKTLLEGADAIVDISKKFNLPYDQVVKKMKEDDEAGLVIQRGEETISVRKKEE